MKNKNIKNLIFGNVCFKTLTVAVCICTLFSFASFAKWQQQGTDFYYINDNNGQYVRADWIQTQYGYYYIDETGRMVRGWRLIGNDYYYFAENGLMQTGFVEAGGSKYYLNTDGRMVRGWVEFVAAGEATYCYFDDNGQMANGWKAIGDYWYYFNDYKCIVNSWANIENEWYRFNQSGQMVTGWYLQNNKYYYLSTTTGQMVKGWIQDVNGYKYYLSPVDGTLIQNQTVNIEGTNYTFNQSGQMINTENQADAQFRDMMGSTNVTGTSMNIGIQPGQSNAYSSSTYTNTKNNAPNQGLQQGSTTGPK